MPEKIQRWYKMKLWTQKQVMQAAEKGVITRQQAEGIIHEEESA